jgi:hypothetical protein
MTDGNEAIFIYSLAHDDTDEQIIKHTYPLLKYGKAYVKLVPIF